jgi:hypothetical protein
LLNKIIKNTLSIKSKQNVKSENYISLNSKWWGYRKLFIYCLIKKFKISF